MIRSLLNALSVDTLILDIFIILGVVVAGSLIVYFAWEAIAKALEKNKDSSHTDELFFEKKNSKENVAVEDFVLDSDEKTADVEDEQENVESQEENSLIDENKITEVDEIKAEEEKSEITAESEEQENADRRAILEARRQELIKRMQMQSQEENEEDDESESEEESDDEESTNDDIETEEEQEPEEDEEVEQDSADALEEERNALNAEKERYQIMIKELEKAKQALAEQAQKETVKEEPAPVALSLEDLKARLADAEERLKVSEKEFKQCKKDYIPLKKVWTAHEKDEKKLRRKEALVAKQKVLLYGVNNYADIDQEKAQKLAEDLDLLDGLKLSVQHCEEVMKDNEERYPLLEKMYNVLKLRNDEIKKDIETYKAEIAKLEGEQGSQE